jgi:ketosteroid isomerase-like protein
MKAGVVKGRLKLDKLDEAVEVFTTESVPALAQIPGCADAQFWVDRRSGEFLGLAMFENDDARKAAGRVLADARPEMPDRMDGPVPERELFELEASMAMDTQAVVERAVDAVNSGDLERLARDLAPDILLRHVRSGGSEYRGPQAVKEHYQSWLKVFSDPHVTANTIVAVGNTAILAGDFSGTHTGSLRTPAGDIPGTGRKVRHEFVEVITVDRGLIHQIVSYSDYASVLMQLGLTQTQIAASS